MKMANKEMAYLNVGNDEFEIVDEAGRQATEAVDEKVDDLTADDIPYSSTQSTKDKIDSLSAITTLNFADYITTETETNIVYGYAKKIAPNIGWFSFGVEHICAVGQTKILNISNKFKEDILTGVRIAGTSNPDNYGAAVCLLNVASRGIYVDTNIRGSVIIASFLAVIE